MKGKPTKAEAGYAFTLARGARLLLVTAASCLFLAVLYPWAGDYYPEETGSVGRFRCSGSRRPATSSLVDLSAAVLTPLIFAFVMKPGRVSAFLSLLGISAWVGFGVWLASMAAVSVAALPLAAAGPRPRAHIIRRSHPIEPLPGWGHLRPSGLRFRFRRALLSALQGLTPAGYEPAPLWGKMPAATCPVRRPRKEERPCTSAWTSDSYVRFLTESVEAQTGMRGPGVPCYGARGDGRTGGRAGGQAARWSADRCPKRHAVGGQRIKLPSVGEKTEAGPVI